jgi:uncharacterized protein YigE (DUF2233 family)
VLENKQFWRVGFSDGGGLEVVFGNKIATFFAEFATFCKKALQIQNPIFMPNNLTG